MHGQRRTAFKKTNKNPIKPKPNKTPSPKKTKPKQKKTKPQKP